MNTPSSSPSDSTEQAAWQTSQNLYQLLGNSIRLEETCQIALRFILRAFDRTGGMIMVAMPGSIHTACIAEENLPISWVDQIEDQSSTLHKMAQDTMHAGVPFLPGEEQGLENLAASLPLFLESEPLGVLLLLGDACSAKEIEQIALLTLPISRAIYKDRLLYANRQSIHELAALYSKLTDSSLSLDYDNLLAEMIKDATNIMSCHIGAITLIDENREEWVLRKILDQDHEWTYEVSPRQGKGLVKECLHTNKLILLNNPSEDPRFDPSSDGFKGLKIHSFLCAPIVIDDQAVGAIQMLNKKYGSFDRYDQDLLTMISMLTARALYSRRLIQQIKVARADLEASHWELSGARNTLDAIFSHIPAAMYVINRQFKLEAINRVRAEASGQKSESLLGMPCYQALFNRSEKCTDCRVGETINNGTTSQRSERRNYSFNETVEWEINSYPILNEDGQIIQALLFEQDVTEKRHLEGILAQSEKLAAVGQLAAGVAHEINNPLTAIIANAQILHRELPQDDDLQESVDLIARAGARAAQVVRNLLDFARKDEYHLGLTDLNETLQRALEMVQHELVARNAVLEFKPDPNLPSILASQDHLQSVWLNLLLNAIDSLEDAGRSVKPRKQSGKIKVSSQRIGNEIYISIADNGKGIPAEHLTRIFEPFYTTKAPGRGTGLGLSVCHRIVKQHGGHIRVESQVSIGSKFTVVLPMS